MLAKVRRTGFIFSLSRRKGGIAVEALAGRRRGGGGDSVPSVLINPAQRAELLRGAQGRSLTQLWPGSELPAMRFGRAAFRARPGEKPLGIREIPWKWAEPVREARGGWSRALGVP